MVRKRLSPPGSNRGATDPTAVQASACRIDDKDLCPMGSLLGAEQGQQVVIQKCGHEL